MTIRCMIAAVAGGSAALLTDGLVQPTSRGLVDLAAQSAGNRDGANTPPDWAQRANRLGFAATTDFDRLSSIEAFLQPLTETPTDARLLGFALGYTYAMRHPVNDLKSIRGDVADREAFVRFVLPGIIAARERQPDPLALFEAIDSGWWAELRANTELSAEVAAVCIRLAAESGKLDPETTIDVLELRPHGTKDGEPTVNAARLALETAAIFSPATFDALGRRMEERHPGISVEALSNADLPPDALASSIAHLPRVSREELARRLSMRAINGTPSEIERFVACFPDPAEIPPDTAATFVFALALLGPERLEDWIGGLSLEQRTLIYGNFTQVLGHYRSRQVDERMHLIGFRSAQILRTPGIRGAIANPYVANLISDCEDRELLDGIYKELKGTTDPASREARQNALFYLYFRTFDEDGAASLEDIIQGTAPDLTDEERAMAERILVMKDFARAETLQRETSDPALAFRLGARLISDTGFLYSKTNAERFEVLARRLESEQGELTPATARAVRTYLLFSGADRSAISAMVERLPEGGFREKVMRDLVSQDGEYDPVWISDWLSNLPPSQSRDVAVSELIKSSHDDPEGSLANAAAIQDSALRQRATAELVTRWSKIDPEAMAGWIRASPLSPADKETLGKLLKGDKG